MKNFKNGIGGFGLLPTLAVTVACAQPTTQAPVAWETNLRVVVTSESGQAVPNALVTVKVFSKTAVPITVDSASGHTNAVGEFLFRRVAPLGGMYPILIGVVPQSGGNLSPATVSDSTDWSPIPAPTRTVNVVLRR